MQTPHVRTHRSRIAASSPAKPEDGARLPRPLYPDSAEARLERRGDEALARYLADDPREPRYTHADRFWVAAGVIALLVGCAMLYAFALATLPLPRIDVAPVDIVRGDS